MLKKNSYIYPHHLFLWLLRHVQNKEIKEYWPLKAMEGQNYTCLGPFFLQNKNNSSIMHALSQSDLDWLIN